MQSENLVINNQYLSAGNHDYPPWFPPYRPIDKNVDEVLSGMWYHESSNDPVVVYHPCKWQSHSVSCIARQWSFVSHDPKLNNGITYDVVPLSALMGHCHCCS